MESVEVKKGSKYKLPECTFTPKVGYVFKYWDTSVGKVKAGYSIKIGFNDKYDIYAKCEKAG